MKKLILWLFVVGCLAGDTGTCAITVTTSAAPIIASQLTNISTRAFVQTGDNVMIGGFIVQGTQSKRVILRAIGPELSQYGVSNTLPDPTLELHDSTGALIASNDNWQHTIIGGIITTDQVYDIIDSTGDAGTTSEKSACSQPTRLFLVFRLGDRSCPM